MDLLDQRCSFEYTEEIEAQEILKGLSRTSFGRIEEWGST